MPSVRNATYISSIVIAQSVDDWWIREQEGPVHRTNEVSFAVLSLLTSRGEESDHRIWPKNQSTTSVSPVENVAIPSSSYPLLPLHVLFPSASSVAPQNSRESRNFTANISAVCRLVLWLLAAFLRPNSKAYVFVIFLLLRPFWPAWSGHTPPRVFRVSPKIVLRGNRRNYSCFCVVLGQFLSMVDTLWSLQLPGVRYRIDDVDATYLAHLMRNTVAQYAIQNCCQY